MHNVGLSVSANITGERIQDVMFWAIIGKSVCLRLSHESRMCVFQREFFPSKVKEMCRCFLFRKKRRGDTAFCVSFLLKVMSFE
jgi:hypothetical protein